MKHLVINDVHLGVRRVSGTTPASAELLRHQLLLNLSGLIMEHTDKDLIVAGDLFDAFEVDHRDLFGAYSVLSAWLVKSGRFLTLVAGNHDLSPKGEKLSSFSLLGRILQQQFPNLVTVLDNGWDVMEGPVVLMSHVANQDIFLHHLEEVEALAPGMVILHANCASTFAEHSDHSLNVPYDWLKATKHKVLFAHEHQNRTLLNGKVVIMGNQWPSSIIDCMPHGDGQKDGLKYAHIIDNETMEVERIKTWGSHGSFTEVDWRDLDKPIVNTIQFIKVVGRAHASEASDVVSAISRFRSTVDCFVVANYVKVDGVPDMDDLTDSTFESVKSFDVLAALLEMLNEDEVKVVKGLLNAA